MSPATSATASHRSTRHRPARPPRSRSTTPTTCTSRPTAATRSSWPRRCSGSTSATRTRWRLQRSLPVPMRAASTTWTSPPTAATLLAQLRVRGPDDRGRRRARARWDDRCTRGAGGDAAGRQALAGRPLFYVADMVATGVWVIDGDALRRSIGFLPTGRGAHGLYLEPRRPRLYISNRGEGSVSVLDFATGQVVATWHDPRRRQPGHGRRVGGRPVLWLSGRYNGVVYAIDTADRAPAGADPGRHRTPRPVRLAAARPLLARPHRHHALTSRILRGHRTADRSSPRRRFRPLRNVGG